jgi:hypothetical protein
MDLECLADCPPSTLVTWITFVAIGAVGFALARWRRWILILWLPSSLLVTVPLFLGGWNGLGSSILIPAGVGWIIALTGAIDRGRGYHPGAA